MLLDQIKQPNDIKKISPRDYPALAAEIREFLVNKISVTGGHLGSNLGAVELTMALHLVLDLPQDKIIWDVGHQSYTHKLLTGRREGFESLRKYGGMSGFPKRKESDCDSFDTGHSSTSISAGLGLVKARDLQGEDYTVVSVIGDGSLTGGMAYEALNNAARLETNFIIILNDNNMSISENVGGVSKYLNNIRTSNAYLDVKDGIYYAIRNTKYGDPVVAGIRRAKNSLKQLVIPGMFFEDMGVTYLGPVDGHDTTALVRVIREAKRRKNAVLIHVLTKKGKGYAPAERHPARFHGAEPFDVQTGVPLKKKMKANYTDIFSTVMMKLGQRNDKIVAITAAMPDGTGLKRFSHAYPDRFFDVGIAEQHAVTFAAGLAAGGLKPVVAIYSSFLQRAYDQILHDVCIQNLPVIFAIDRAGLVGSDGETHQGIFDLSYLSSIPNMHICAPKNKWELSDMLKFAVAFPAPIAIRYPRGEAYDGLAQFRAPVEYGKAEMIYEEEGIALLAVGSMVKTAEGVRERLKECGLSCTLVNARFVKPMDEEMVCRLSATHRLIVTMEENVESGGFGERVRTFADEQELPGQILSITIPDEYVEHGNVELLKKEIGIDEESVTKRILEEWNRI
ncbi:MAG TPA: 1-deoxy-D-xylulose-5-phosphate synthase [Candidatus Eisenbergiella intestinigallinarum]|uniref:1-deoxy-D-xylulose-5-phosphate synthase n=1 Tax=Candidatus Eisenbergiella intestinigallinarum TaxID=2838549 RepID=A0A9D2QIN2_9FIRM|nr:1-deoxy-D-xylulose-5-phosphate synthase [Candidatus Eisenbergiella intestinigallinarum]